MADELQNGATEIDRRMWDVNTQLIRGVNPYGTEGTRPPQYLGWGGLQ